MSIEIEKKARIPENDFLEVAKLLDEAYGKGSMIRKQDYFYKNAFTDGKALRLRKAGNSGVWSSSDSGLYEVCSKVKNVMDDGTEVNEEIETIIRVENPDIFKKALENAGLVYEYSKTKTGFEWNIPMKYKNNDFTLHAELMTVACDNGYKDYFLEIEYTGDCKVELSGEYVSGKITEVFQRFNLTDIEPRKYVELILNKI